MVKNRAIHLIFGLGLSVLGAAVSSPSAWAIQAARLGYAEDTAKIANLTIDSMQVTITEDPQPDGSRFVASVGGKFTTPYWTLLLGRNVIPLENDGRFDVKIPITGNQTTAVFVAVGPLGEIERQVMLVYADMAGLNLLAGKDELQAHLPQMNFGLGFSNVNFTESDVGVGIANPNISFSEIMLTAKFGVTKRFEGSNWNFGLTAFLNLVPIIHNSDDVARFLGINLRAGYIIPKIQDPWRLTVYGGFYYITMLTNGGFGFQNVGGPQLYPVLTRAFTGNRALSAYLKFSPISDNIGFVSLASHEFAGGLIYSQPFTEGHTIAYTLDISSLALDINDQGSSGGQPVNSHYTSSTISLGVSYGL